MSLEKAAADFAVMAVMPTTSGNTRGIKHHSRDQACEQDWGDPRLRLPGVVRDEAKLPAALSSSGAKAGPPTLRAEDGAEDPAEACPGRGTQRARRCRSPLTGGTRRAPTGGRRAAPNEMP